MKRKIEINDVIAVLWGEDMLRGKKFKDDVAYVRRLTIEANKFNSEKHEKDIFRTNER